MCGLVGVWPLGHARPSETTLQAAISTLKHRGPDAFSVKTFPGAGLAHARLSLVDLHSRSNQPFMDDSGRYALIFNGEVYNFRELRAELEQRNIRFHTESDTEVVLQALIHWGEPALERFNGMFGLAFTDLETGSVLLARDRFGMKPLYYTVHNGTLMAASEVKALHALRPLTPDIGSVTAYLLNFGGPTSGKSFYHGISSLPPGTRLIRGSNGDVDIDNFFRLSNFLDNDEMERLRSIDARTVVDEFEGLMSESVDRHLFADATVGAFCSGGVDSSLIVAMAARRRKDVQLFHANVVGSWSELGAAQALADHLKLPLHSVDVEEQEFVDLIPRCMTHYEYPFTYHPNCAPLMMIAQCARDRGVKGLLSGEGSDELFLGYPWLGRKWITDRYETMLDRTLKTMRSIPGLGPIIVPDKMGNLKEVRDILNGREMADDQAEVAAAIQDLQSRVDPHTSWTLDYLHHHLRTLLHRNDTMGMSASIEARFPFLDEHVARFGVNLPGKYKLRRSPFVFEKAHPFIRDKWVVREVAARYIPSGLSQRIKIGFWTTVFQRLDISESFFRNSPVQDILSLSTAQLNRTLETGSYDLRRRLMMVDIWSRTMLSGEPHEASVQRLRDNVSILDRQTDAHTMAASS